MRTEEIRPAVYILASRKYGVIYIGVTSALWNRVATHKDAGVAGFTQKYSVHSLVWYEHHQTMETAIRREKQLKKWNRSWKIELIEKMNPTWRDLHNEIDFDGTISTQVVISAKAGISVSPSQNTDARFRGHDDCWFDNMTKSESAS